MLSDDTLYMLAGPLFFFALLIVNTERGAGSRGIDLPVIESMWHYIYSHGDYDTFSDRRQDVRIASKIVSQHFMRCMLLSPAGVCLNNEFGGTRALNGLPRWINWLAQMDPRVAVAALARSAECAVRSGVYSAVELEYNNGVDYAAHWLPELGRLRLRVGCGDLASRIARVDVQLDSIPQVVGPLGQTWGGFQLVLAGQVDTDLRNSNPCAPQVCSACSYMILICGLLLLTLGGKKCYCTTKCATGCRYLL
jgi:hypothetical protein